MNGFWTLNSANINSIPRTLRTKQIFCQKFNRCHVSYCMYVCAFSKNAQPSSIVHADNVPRDSLGLRISHLGPTDIS